MPKGKPCKWCQTNPAAIPINRSGIGRLTHDICKECHAKRLAEDLKVVLHRSKLNNKEVCCD